MRMHFSFDEDDYEAHDGKVDYPVSNASVRLEDAEYLPDVLDAFLRFLQMAGFTYVERLTAFSVDSEHSSTH